MKKLLIILAILMIPVSGWTTAYYACQAAQNLTGDATWCTAAQISGSCAATGARTAWGIVAADSPTLYANGCTVVVNDSFTAVALSTADGDGAGVAVAGGGFTYATALNKTITANITPGTTTCLTISGSTGGGTIVGDITGGVGTGVNGVTTSHTSVTLNVQGTITGGTHAAAHGWYSYGATGSMSLTVGNAVAASDGNAILLLAAGTASVGTACVGSDAGKGAGCRAESTGSITVTGNIMNGTRGSGAEGTIIWVPTAPSSGVTGHYFKSNGGGTAVFAGKNTDDVTKALTTFYYIDPTDGTSDQGTAGGGGGAWSY